jgi:DNA topoisomerase I
MSKSLLIVESPAKAKTIKKYVGDEYDVLASKGHVMDLPKRGGVDVEHGFQESYELLEEKGKSEVVKAIRSSAKKVERVLLATDPDREGEAIAFHLRDIVKESNPGAEIKRVLFNEITKKGVLEGISQPRDLDTNLYEAQRTRRVLDRIGGYPLSNLLWTKFTFGLSAGRVQTPALRIVVDRQRERDAFVPQNYWLVTAQLVGATEPSFEAALASIDGKPLDKVASRLAATSEPQASRCKADLDKASYRVTSVKKRETRRKAPAPYTTSKLQQDASTRLRMAPKRTMSVAQKLYEGVTIGKGKNAEIVGLITYMRTDSVRLSNDAVDECRAYVAKTYGKGAVPEEPNVFKTKKQNVQDAHEAIRPTRMDLPPESLESVLAPEQLKLYRLIWNRFVACQMIPAVYDQTRVEIDASADGRSYGLRASGSTLKEAGWRAVYGASSQPLAGEDEEEGAEGGDDEEALLPALNEGDVLTLKIPPGVVVEHKQTEPPPLYNEASLVKKLEEEGIGRPSTYAEIISKVQQRDYVQNVDGRLVPTPLGKLVIGKLVDEGFDLADIGFSRKLEEELDAVADSRAKRLDVLAPFHDRLQEQIERAKGAKGKWWPEPVTLDTPCPKCGSAIAKRWGRNGQFIGCTAYPDCDFTQNLDAEGNPEEEKQPELTDYDCQLCGAKMYKRWGRNGFFLGCSRYPECKGTRPVPLGFKCPKCKTGDIIQIKPRGRGRPFYGCSNYNSDAKCDFRIFQQPIAESCPQCNTEFLVRGGKKDEPTLKCPYCTYERPYDLDDEPEAEEPATGKTKRAG